MGFRSGVWAKVWSVQPKSDKITDLRVSITKKNPATNEYEQEFGGFVSVMGAGPAAKAAKLQEGDRIRLGDTDVRAVYDKESGTSRYYFRVFGFETQNEANSGGGTSGGTTRRQAVPSRSVDDGEYETADLPF